MYRNLSLDSSRDLDVFYVEHSSEEGSPVRNNTTEILNSVELSGVLARETIRISSIASPEPQRVTIDSVSNEPIFPYGFGNQNSMMPPSLNDINFPPNSFNVLAKTAVI